MFLGLSVAKVQKKFIYSKKRIEVSFKIDKFYNLLCSLMYDKYVIILFVFLIYLKYCICSIV